MQVRGDEALSIKCTPYLLLKLFHLGEILHLLVLHKGGNGTVHH